MRTTMLVKSLAILTLGCASAGWSAERPSAIESLTLGQAIDLAGRQHPELAEAGARVVAAEGRAQQDAKPSNPELIARIEAAPFRGSTTGGADYLAGVSQSVPLGNRLSKAREAGQREREQRSLELEAKWREVRRRVHGAFATALYQEKAFETQKRIVQTLEGAVRTTKARVDAGDAIPEDLARVEMELVREKTELQRTESMRKQAMTALTAAIGDPALAVKSLAGDLDATFEIPTLESLAASVSAHPAAAAANAEVRWQNARLDLAKAQRIPDVKVELLYRRIEGQKQDAFDLGLGIPLPLFDRNQGRLREVRADMQASEARARATQNELSRQANEAHTRLTAALAASRTMKTELLPRAEIVLKAAEARYAGGDIGLTEVLPVRRDWAAAQLAYQETLRELMHAWADVQSFLARNQTQQAFVVPPH
ncbi:MAG: TolC family protein [Verrucomicrobiota bacterium]